jgi:hypothetical protein
LGLRTWYWTFWFLGGFLYCLGDSRLVYFPTIFLFQSLLASIHSFVCFSKSKVTPLHARCGPEGG